MELFWPARWGLCIAPVLGSGAVAGCPVLVQLDGSGFWSQISRSTTEEVGLSWKLRLFRAGRPCCNHSHCEVCAGRILVDRVGSWVAVLLPIYCHVYGKLGLLRDVGNYPKRVGVRTDHRVSRQSSSRHRQVRVLMARKIRVCLGRAGHRLPQGQHQRGGGLPARGLGGLRQARPHPGKRKNTGHLLVRSPLRGTQEVGLPLVDKVDSKHRKSTWGRCRNGGLLFQRHEG